MSSNKFWPGMAAVNAPLFTMLALVLLLAVFVWRIFLPQAETMKFGENKAGANGKGSGSVKAASKLLENENAARSSENNPFSSVYLERMIAEKESARLAAQKTHEEKIAEPKDIPKAVPAEEVKVAVPDNAVSLENPPLPRTMRFVYKGMMTSLDGERLALVENCTENTCSYHKAGAVLGWMKIKDFDRGSMNISINGEVKTLERGVAVEVQGTDRK